MKKACLLLSLILSSQLLFSGCEMIDAAKEKLDANSIIGKSTQTQANSNEDKTSDSDADIDTVKDAGDNASDADKDTSSDTSDASTSTDTPKDTTSTPTNNDTASSTKTNTSTDTKKETTKSTTTGPILVNKKEIEAFSSMSKAGLIRSFGDNYKLEVGVLTFPNGLSFIGISGDKSKPSSIKFKDNVVIMGIKNGMNFEKVQSILGKTEVIQSYLNTKSNIVYKVQYNLDNGVLKVISPNKDGKNSYIQVVPNR